jgi:hypothetical protein
MQHHVDILSAKLDRVDLEKQVHNQTLSAEIVKLRSQINHKIREQVTLFSFFPSFFFFPSHTLV